MIPQQHRKKAAWVGICVALTSGFEGIRQTAYQDIGNPAIWTVCMGETKGVKKGDHYSIPECETMLEGRLIEFGDGVDRCTTVELPTKRKAAVTDFAYNEGLTRYCKYIAPKLNAGKTQEACDHLLQFNKAAGIVFPGLTKRREAERKLCLEGVA